MLDTFTNDYDLLRKSDGKLAGWKNGIMENWKRGKMENLNIGKWNVAILGLPA